VAVEIDPQTVFRVEALGLLADKVVELRSQALTEPGKISAGMMQ
jgi:hypothetical protein